MSELFLNRPEQIAIKNDIHAIAKALETISLVMPDKKKVTIEKKIDDEFFGKLHMSQEHMTMWSMEFETTCLALISLMEECAELQQAASKYYRHYRTSTHDHCTSEKEAMIEEMAHVLICIRMICSNFDISPEDIQKEIYKKYPDGYITKKGENEDG